jgi:hypothetical protein
MLNNNVEAEHLGGGVVLFRNAISFDVAWAVQFAEEQISKEREEMYTKAVDPETGEPAYLNKSGYYFKAYGVDIMPRRGSQIHGTSRDDVRDFIEAVERAKDEYLLKYFVLFPIAYKNVWWKVKGHLVSYSTQYGGSFLGPHSDTSADYAYGYPHPGNQLATRNSVSCVVYINDDFDGGHHYFNYLDIDYKPNSGDILMFPANYMASHEVTPIINGSRYSYLGWYAQGSPNKEVNEHIVDPATDPELAKTATNVYMPTLREDFKNYLDSIDHDKSSHAYQLVERMSS